MVQQGKALTRTAVSALLFEVCKQGLKDSGREHALTAPREEAGLKALPVELGS